MAPEDHSRAQDRQERADVLAKCVSDTVDFINRLSPGAVRSYGAAGVLLANSYFLISDAYKRRRGMQESRTHLYKVAAFTVAAIMAVRPIRVSDETNVVSTRVAFANQQCAMRAVQGLLGFDIESLDDDFVRRLYDSVFDPIELPSLAGYLAEFESKLGPFSSAIFSDIEQAIAFDRHNTLEFSVPELHTLEALITQFTTLEQAKGHPFIRVLLGGWRKWWS